MDDTTIARETLVWIEDNFHEFRNFSTFEKLERDECQHIHGAMRKIVLKDAWELATTNQDKKSILDKLVTRFLPDEAIVPIESVQSIQNKFQNICYGDGVTPSPKPTANVNVVNESKPTPSPVESNVVKEKVTPLATKVEIKRVQIQVLFFTEEAKEFFPKEKDNFIKLIRKTLSRVVEMLPSRLHEMRLFEPIQITDKFGFFQFDPMFQQMAISVVSKQKLPLRWTLVEDGEIEFEMVEKKVEETEEVRQLSLEEWVRKVAEMTKKEEKANEWIDELRRQDVQSLNDLMKWKDQEWTAFNKISLHAKISLRENLSNVQVIKPINTQCVRLASCHKIKRFLYYNLNLKEYTDLPFIDRDLIDKTFQEFKYEGDSVIRTIKQKFQKYSQVSGKYPRGVLLYGPPGTGKTDICRNVVQRLGITEVSPSLASTELNRSLVGETEKLILDIFQRALRVPHLLCCVYVDEIDALVPKRTEKTAGHKTDALSVILALIEGIKDVPNLILIGSTNRRNQIDGAIMRRMSSQIFVGRAGPEARLNILKNILLKEKAPINNFSPGVVQSLINCTTNFSGAAIVGFAYALASLWKDMQIREINEYEQTQLIYTELCDVCDFYGAKIGTYLLPELISDPNSVIFLGEDQESKNDQDFYTGKVLLDLRSNILQFEARNSQLEEIYFGNVFKNTQHPTLRDVMPTFAEFARRRKLECIQLFDMELVYSNSAFDDNTKFEILIEKLEESRMYDKILMIFDADSLVGVGENESQSNMGTSSSFSIQDHKTWNWIMSAMKNPKMNKVSEHWVVIVCRHEYLISQFKKANDFPWSEDENTKNEEEEDMKTRVRQCINCKKRYHESDNKITECTYHNGDLIYKNSIGGTTKLTPDILMTNPTWGETATYTCCQNNRTSAGCYNDRHVCEE